MAEVERVRIAVDGSELEVADGALLIEVAEDHGIYIPRFCWHRRMNPVGMCRMCLVEIETPRGRMLTTSCTTRVSEGMSVDTQSDVVKKAQEGVLEFLLINHPLDCPVCDRGGECPLQDQTMAYGPGDSRFIEEKRHFPKPIEISDLVLLDRERCILCARCTRFSAEVSGDPLIDFQDRGNFTQVLTFPDEPFASYFSGNTVQICPVGALTAKPYRFRARPWDLEAVESVSLMDSVHSKVSVQSSQNQIVRINGVDNEATNQGWLSDKDRFVFEHINSTERLTVPLLREGGDFREASWNEALESVAERLGGYLGTEVAGIGGSRSSNEEAFAFGKFLRTIVVTPHLDAQMDDGLDPEFLVGVTPRARLSQLDQAGAILLWGPDLKEEFPVLYLRVRRAATQLGAKLVVVHPRRTGLADVAHASLSYRPGQGAELLKRLAGGVGELGTTRAELENGPVIALVGRPGLSEDPRLAEAVAAFARELPGGAILPLCHRGNVFGALDMGLAPTLLPGRVSVTDQLRRLELEDRWGPLPSGLGLSSPGIFRELADGELKALVLLGADPVRDLPNPQLVRRGLEGAEFVVALDLFLSDTARLADVVLPVEGFSESEGTVTNLEGRVQKVNKVIPGPGQARAAWAVLDDLARLMGGNLGAPSAETLSKEIADVAPAYRGVGWEVLDWGGGREGVVVPLQSGEQPLQYVPVDPGLPTLDDGVALHLARVLYDDGVLTRFSPSLARLAPQGRAFLSPGYAAALGVDDGDVVSVESDVGAVVLPVGRDDGLADGVVYVPFNLAETAALGASRSVRVEPVPSGASS